MRWLKKRAFWRGLKEIAKNCRTALPDLVDIDAAREHSNLSSAIRLFVLDYFKRVQVCVPSFRKCRIGARSIVEVMQAFASAR
jgi:predicted DNA-binding ribbon-helix-helix protein